MSSKTSYWRKDRR